MSVCSCYRDMENWLHERGVCYGTKECEPCSCGGDESKCNFYPEKRKPQTNADRIRAMTDKELAEQICRLYLTHPGVDADGIMTKMGL